MRWNETLRQFFPAVVNNQCPNLRFSGNLTSAFPTLKCVKILCFKIVLKILAIEASCVFFHQWFSDWTQIYDTDNVHLICVNTRNSDVWICISLPTRFQFSHQTNHLFNLTKGSTNVSSKLEAVDALKQKLKLLLESYRRYFNFRISMCFPVCFYFQL